MLLKSFLSIENSVFVKAGSALDEDSIPLWNAFKQVWQQAASLLSSWCSHLNCSNHAVWNEWSFCWILTPEGLSNFSAGLDYLIRLQKLDLEGWVVPLLFPVCQLLLWMAPNHFDFQVVLWFGLFLRLHQARPVSLVRSLTHDKSVPHLFSTAQSTANWNSYPLVEETRPSKWRQWHVVSSRPYVDIFSANMERTSVLGYLRMR